MQANADMERIMEDVEIFLSRLANEEKLYAETAKKLDDPDINDKFTLAGAIAEKGSPASYKVYVSNEETENAAVDEIKEHFHDCMLPQQPNHKFSL